MSNASKQDRQGARTLAELTSRYNFGKSFAEVMGFAEAAQKAADEANKAVSLLGEKLTQEEIFNILTNNGKSQGLYRDDDGELYINATYILSDTFRAELIKIGVLTSSDGTVKIDLNNNRVTVDGKLSATVNGITKDYKTQVVISASGMKLYGENSKGEMEEVIDFGGGVGGKPAGIINPSWKENIGLVIATAMGTLMLGTSEAGTEIFGSRVSIDSPTGDVSILGKQVYWKDNGDGTSTLCGY